VDTFVVECLRCGCTRLVARTVFRRLDTPECPRCGYLGWAPMLELTETQRGGLRERPVEQRRLPHVA
jgi:hypothetical protein